MRMSWDEYFLNLAASVALRSEDPSTKVGAIIVDKDNRIISTGYNGLPKGVSLTHEWNSDLKYLHVIHAEMNAILYAKQDLQGCKIYCTLSPCKECLKNIVAAGIKQVIFSKVYLKEDYIALLKLIKQLDRFGG